MTERDASPEGPVSDNPGEADQPVPGKPARRRAVIPRHAASLILWREGRDGAEVLMGVRHARHRFMPGVLVFPGGAVDRADRTAPAVSELRPEAEAMLRRQADARLARGLAVAAIRELQEETGLVIGTPGRDGVHPALDWLEYLCRAVTPPSRPMRFNARFLIAPAEAATGEMRGSGELEELRYFSLQEALSRPHASITARILEEFGAWLAMGTAERTARPLIVFKGMDTRLTED